MTNSLTHRDRHAASEPAVDQSRYLTDGTHLYRRATEAHADDGFVWLEDCHSLELILVTAEATRALGAVPTRQPAVDV
jgi:hypothetical protein